MSREERLFARWVFAQMQLKYRWEARMPELDAEAYLDAYYRYADELV